LKNDDDDYGDGEGSDFFEDMAELHEVTFATGFEEALLGIAQQFNKCFVVYDYEKVLEILMDQGMSHGEAIKFSDRNILGAWVGEQTPAYLIKRVRNILDDEGDLDAHSSS